MMVGHHLSHGHVKVPAENLLCPASPLPGYLNLFFFNYRPRPEVSLWVWKGLPQLSTSRGNPGVSWRRSQPKAEKPVPWWHSFPSCPPPCSFLTHSHGAAAGDGSSFQPAGPALLVLGREGWCWWGRAEEQPPSAWQAKDERPASEQGVKGQFSAPA